MAANEHDGSDIRVSSEDGRIRAVAWPESWNLGPDSKRDAVMAAMVDAIVGLPVDLEPSALAARLRAAIPFGGEFVDATPIELARRIHAALGAPRPTIRVGAFTGDAIDELTRSWRGFEWRIVPEQPLSAAVNVALDEVLEESQRPSLRFWGWAEPAIVIGRCQSIANEVDRDSLRERGIALVRRSSGGGAMFAQPRGTITWSMVLPEPALAGLTIRQSYEVCDAWVIRCLRELGVDAHHVPVNDIACAEGKIAGAAQARRRGRVLHHTTLAYDLRMDELAAVLRIGREKRVGNAVASAAKVVSPLRHHIEHPREAVVERLRAAFLARFGGTVEPLTGAEVAAAEAVAWRKYAHPDWTDSFA
jgi:lipoate-protein ligase A